MSFFYVRHLAGDVSWTAVRALGRAALRCAHLPPGAAFGSPRGGAEGPAAIEGLAAGPVIPKSSAFRPPISGADVLPVSAPASGGRVEGLALPPGVAGAPLCRRVHPHLRAGDAALVTGLAAATGGVPASVPPVASNVPAGHGALPPWGAPGRGLKFPGGRIPIGHVSPAPVRVSTAPRVFPAFQTPSAAQVAARGVPNLCDSEGTF